MGAILFVSIIWLIILGSVFCCFFYWKFLFQVAKGMKIEYECPSDEKDDVVVTTETEPSPIKRQSIFTQNPLTTTSLMDNRVSVVGGIVGINHNKQLSVPPAPHDLSLTVLTVEDKLEGNLDQHHHHSEEKDIKINAIYPEKPVSNHENLAADSGNNSEFQFHDDRIKTFHLISFDHNIFRVAKIWSPHIKQPFLAANANNIIHQVEGVVVPSECTVRIESVPLQYFTNCVLYAETTLTRDTSTEKYCELLSKLRLVFENNFIFFTLFFIILALIHCFYMPFTMSLSTADYSVDGAYYGQTITGLIFFFTILSIIFHIGFLFKSRHNKVLWIRILILISVVLAVLVLSLVSDLLAISRTYHSSSSSTSSSSSSSSSSSGSSSSSWNDFLCQCSDDSSRRRLSDDGTSYSFVCDNAQYTAANHNNCGMDCGVCGWTYWSPFVTYTVFGTLFALAALIFAFVDYWKIVPIYPKGKTVKMSVDKKKINTHMVIVLHGSKSFGYPITAKLSIADALVVEKKLHLLQQQLQYQVPVGSDHNNSYNGREAVLLPHFAAVGSYTSISVQSTVTNIFATLSNFLKTVLYIAFKLVGLQ